MPRQDEKLSLYLTPPVPARVIDRDGSLVFQMPGNSEQATRTAARFVACWNACAGIHTEVLEAMPMWTNETVSALIEAADNIKHALSGKPMDGQTLEALTYLAEAMKPFGPRSEWQVGGQSEAARLRAALAECNGVVQAAIANARHRNEYPHIIANLERIEAAARAALGGDEA